MNNPEIIDFPPKRQQISLSPETPEIGTLDPAHGIQSIKTTIKSEFGVAELEKYTDNDTELYKFKLQLKGLKPEIATEIIRAIKPFFEDPTSPQLSLFPKD